VLVERATRICRLVRKHPEVVELISWYCDGLDLDKVDPGLTVEDFALTNRLDPDTFVEDVQHEISSAQEPDQGFAQSEAGDEDEGDDGEEKDELSLAWDDEDRDEDEGYEDEDEEDLSDYFGDDEDLDSELVDVDPDDGDLASAWLDD